MKVSYSVWSSAHSQVSRRFLSIAAIACQQAHQVVRIQRLHVTTYWGACNKNNNKKPTLLSYGADHRLINWKEPPLLTKTDCEDVGK